MNDKKIQDTDYQLLDSLISKNIRFALFRLPGEDELQFILQKSPETVCVKTLADLNTQSGFVIAPFCTSETSPIVLIKHDIYIKGERNIFDYIKKLVGLENTIELDKTKKDNSSATFQNYKQKFELFLSAVTKIDFSKLVLSRTYNYSQTTNISIADIFLKANEYYPTNFVYVCYSPETGCWLGSSPELLVAGNNKNWQTVSLAGTQKQTETDTIWDKKNKLEQQIVSDYMEQQLQFGKYKYEKKAPHTIQSGNLKHIKTEFIFEMENQDEIGTLLQLLHPSPAICGYPKKEASDFIKHNEGHDREYYSGFLGCLNLENKTNLYVNLRCMKIEKTNATLYAGGGILPSSDLESEWQETENKLQTMLAILKN